MRDMIDQPLEVGNVVMVLSNFPITGTILRFTKKMVIIEKHNKTKTQTTLYSINLLSLEANYEKYPEIKL